MIWWTSQATQHKCFQQIKTFWLLQNSSNSSNFAVPIMLIHECLHVRKKKHPKMLDAWIIWQSSSLGTIHGAHCSPLPHSHIWKHHSSKWDHYIISQLDQCPMFSLIEDTPNEFQSLKQGLSTRAYLQWPTPCSSTALRTKFYMHPKGAIKKEEDNEKKKRWKKRKTKSQ